jgi:hypothetical protein
MIVVVAQSIGRLKAIDEPSADLRMHEGKNVVEKNQAKASSNFGVPQSMGGSA